MGTVILLVTGSWKHVNWFSPPVVGFRSSLSSSGRRYSVTSVSESIVLQNHTCFKNPMCYEIINYPLCENRCVLSKDVFLRTESHFIFLLITLAQRLRAWGLEQMVMCQIPTP